MPESRQNPARQVKAELGLWRVPVREIYFAAQAKTKVSLSGVFVGPNLLETAESGPNLPLNSLGFFTQRVRNGETYLLVLRLLPCWATRGASAHPV
jgi:hypothetical protein